MKTIWKLQDAKRHFSQVVDDAIRLGPQFISRDVVDVVVVPSIAEYEALSTRRPSFAEFLPSCPKVGDELVLDQQPR